MEEEFRPAINEIVLANGLITVLAWGLASGVVLSLSLPQMVAFPIVELLTLLAVIFFVAKSASSFWLHLTERYYVGDGLIKLQRGWVSRTLTTIPRQNVREAKVEYSVLFRAFGVGHVWIFTKDCYGHKLNNLKNAMGVAEKIDPEFASEPVFRPSVG